jgi:biopolymer transport protein ExbD
MAGAIMGNNKPQRRNNRGFRHPKRRLAVRIDMTPMVDIAFLLLIFYMVTTVFALPQAMEINLPPPVPVDVYHVLMIRVDGDGRFYWNMNPDPAVAMNSDSLRLLLVDKNREYSRLNTLIKIHKKARYRIMVDILDEIEMTEHLLNSAIAQQLGATLNELNDPGHERAAEFKEKRFSYRYAMAPWEDRDTRIVEKALSKEGGE